MKITTKFSLVCVFLLFNISIFTAQEFLDIDIKNRCIYSGSVMDEELYSFSTDVTTMDEIVKKVLELGGGLKRNFYVIQTNVENISAVVYNGKRYLLWSQDFLEKASRIEAYASVAHEIGHHLNRHSLKPEVEKIEEKEADFFMGFILYKLEKPSYSEGEIKDLITHLPKTDAVGFDKSRYETVLEGYKKSEIARKLKGLEWETDASMAAFLKASFPLPPPECNFSYTIPNNLIKNNQNLGDVSRTITKSLEKFNYPYRFMSAQGGFAIVAQMEQYNKDGSLMEGSAYRWVDYPPQESFSLSWSYIKSLVYPKKGYLRMFIFVITKDDYKGADPKIKISKNEAAAWHSQGVNRLPKKIAGMPFSEDYLVNFLVYEFEVPESNHIPKQRCSCLYLAKEHLELSGLQTELGR